jgi:FdhD protein
MNEGFRRVPVVRVGRAEAELPQDTVAVEEPLEVRLHGKPFAVIMRTPGSDKELATGFLLAEGVLRSNDDLGAVEHCRHPHHPDRHNVVDVFLVGDARRDLDRLLEERRNVVASSSCGLCGRVTIESLQRRADPLEPSWRLDAEVVASLPDGLRAGQRLFAETGGLHAAGLFGLDGACTMLAEDVGRHNAVDKVIGASLMAGSLPLNETVLVVSGRTSFEIVQKAWIAGLGLICAVSAPSSLAIDLADAAGITLLGFVRGSGFNVYTHAERLSAV